MIMIARPQLFQSLTDLSMLGLLDCLLWLRFSNNYAITTQSLPHHHNLQYKMGLAPPMADNAFVSSQYYCNTTWHFSAASNIRAKKTEIEPGAGRSDHTRTYPTAAVWRRALQCRPHPRHDVGFDRHRSRDSGPLHIGSVSGGLARAVTRRRPFVVAFATAIVVAAAVVTATVVVVVAVESRSKMMVDPLVGT